MKLFKQQLQACLPDLWRYAFSLCRDRDLAEDLVQDCAERALRKQTLWRREGELKPWLMKMLLNIYRNQLRSRGRGPRLVQLDDLDVQPAGPEVLEDKMALAQTASAMQQLPQEQREALLMVVLGGVSYKQAAQALEIPMGTLMSRLGRARAALRREMSDTPQVTRSNNNSGTKK